MAGTRLAGKVAIVTGGSSGFGAATAQLFASEGAFVLIADLNEAGGVQLAASNPEKIVFQKANIATQETWQQLVQTAEEKFGRLDIVVNNAGTSYANKPTLQVTEAEFDLTMDVNVKSIFWSVKVCVPAMLKNGKKSGAFVNVASIGATRPRPGLVWYAASKGTVANATKGLAAEFAPMGIRVNSVCPLMAATGLWEKFTGMPDTPENREKFTKDVPMGRLTEPIDVAKAILFLASDDAAFIVGENLLVDGGKTI
ncbi:uncharacterized protein A1O9_04290 [Exophiala aquamarina CBS 119918]|uniref:3-oxoacyl-[acyl-carrier protein] reductase n=1 Tax=Exophiala aquamarina CBS 119918 TaxID=1182545 RepID=A0A072PHU3_9EURO|nr:uncharacterized protein A1O9_04290 [Exophiala aquamarina CBS 119918]KEF59446.1 hypothetical protein A1O9_04290 [Exophiala aquamarina CBS 119918]